MSNSTQFVGSQNVWQEWFELSTGLHGRLLAGGLIGLSTGSALVQVTVTSGGNLHVELQPSTESIGILGASTSVIGHIIADASTAKIGALQTSTEVIGHIIADASTAKIGALQASTEVIGHIIADASTSVIGHIIADASTAKIGALQLSTEIIGLVSIDQTTPGVSNAIVITTTGGQAVQFDDTDKLAVSLWGKYSAAGDRSLLASNSGRLLTSIGLSNIEGDAQGGTPMSVDGADSGNGPLAVQAYLWNNNNRDRQRNNHAITVLASTTRSAITASADQTNYNAKAHLLYVAYDTSTGAAITPTLQVKDSLSGLYSTIWTAPAITSGSTGLYTYLWDPAASTATTGYTEVARVRPGRTWRLNMEHSSSGATQYSAAIANLV